MDYKDFLAALNLSKIKESLLNDLIDGDLLDKLYETLKPYIIKAIREAAG